MQWSNKALWGALVGLAFGLLTVIWGFWQAIFILICIGGGYWVGKQVEAYGGWSRWLEYFFRRH